MKVNELMIGDFVTFKDCQNEEEILVIKIWQLNQDGNALVFIDDSKVLDEISIDDEIVGIPLTPEILEKNGFDISDPEVKQYHFTEDGQKYHFTLRQMYNQEDDKPNGYSFYAFNVLTIIDYVHQLQHALKLCGIDKTIEL